MLLQHIHGYCKQQLYPTRWGSTGPAPTTAHHFVHGTRSVDHYIVNEKNARPRETTMSPPLGNTDDTECIISDACPPVTPPARAHDATRRGPSSVAHDLVNGDFSSAHKNCDNNISTMPPTTTTSRSRTKRLDTLLPTSYDDATHQQITQDINNERG
eukprot:2183076-Pyramimonas_sp.AAC.1